MGRQKTWSEENVIAALQRWFEEYGRSPTALEWNRSGETHPSRNTAVNVFGSWSEALSAAELPTRKSGEKIMDSALAPLDVQDEVISMYRRGEGVRAIQARFGLSEGRVKRTLVAAGVAIRTQAEAVMVANRRRFS
jgi:hypothetical protein